MFFFSGDTFLLSKDLVTPSSWTVSHHFHSESPKGTFSQRTEFEMEKELQSVLSFLEKIYKQHTPIWPSNMPFSRVSTYFSSQIWSPLWKITRLFSGSRANPETWPSLRSNPGHSTASSMWKSDQRNK